MATSYSEISAMYSDLHVLNKLCVDAEKGPDLSSREAGALELIPTGVRTRPRRETAATTPPEPRYQVTFPTNFPIEMDYHLGWAVSFSLPESPRRASALLAAQTG